MTNYTGFKFSLKVTCPDCNRTIPVNRIINEIICSNCFTKINLPTFWWKMNIFEMTTLIKVRRYPEGKFFTKTGLSMDIKYVYKLGKVFPRCQTCKDDISENEKWTLEDIKKAIDTLEYLNCKKCNASIAIRKPDTFVNSASKIKIHAILNEETVYKANNKHKGKPMKLTCISCGAGLNADGSERVISCDFCNTENFLPQELWRRIQPISKPKSFFLLADI